MQADLLRRTAALLLTLLLAACASTPSRDGAQTNAPPNLDRMPDAEPRVEALRSGGPNKPYEVGGRSYTPVLADVALRESGLASWYGRKFHGRPTASGEPYDMYAMTAAHKTMPLPSYARVRNPANGREVIVRVNDRGPFAAGRVIDLSYTAALKLGVLGGVATVQVERITNEEIRTGPWQRDAPRPGNDDLAGAEPGAGHWLQLGAFRERDGALALQQRVQGERLARSIAIVDDKGLYRVQAGPYASRAEALAAADKWRALLSTMPILVDRR